MKGITMNISRHITKPLFLAAFSFIFLLSVAFLLVSIQAQAQDQVTWEDIGTCEWSLDSDTGTLTIRPKDGADSGTLPVWTATKTEDDTELNIVIGLCVGHDSLFISHSKAPCTVLATKDRQTNAAFREEIKFLIE